MTRGWSSALTKPDAMTDTGPKFKILKFLKIISASFGVLLLVLFIFASLRTLTLDVNAGLQLARWEKRNNIALAIDHRQRDELLANFKGNVGGTSRRLWTGWRHCQTASSSVLLRAEAVRIPTVSYSEQDINTTALLEFDGFLRRGQSTSVRTPTSRTPTRPTHWCFHSLGITWFTSQTPWSVVSQSSLQFSPPAWSATSWWPTTATCSGCKGHSPTWLRTCCWPTSMWYLPQSRTAGRPRRSRLRRWMVSSMVVEP